MSRTRGRPDGHERVRADSEGHSPFEQPSKSKKLLILLLKIAIVGIIVFALVQIARGVDWTSVWDAFARLSLWQIAVLVVLLAARQILNAVPLAVFAPGLSVRRSVISDLSANLTATVAPPPGDVVLRVAMFRSWRVPLDTGLAGLSLNSLIYYVLRFAAPVVGFVALLLLVRYDESYAIVAAVCGVLAVAIAGVLVLIVRAEGSARWIGRTCARIVQRVRPKGVDEQVWSDKMAEFRLHVEEQMRSGWWKALLALVVMVIVEGLMILAALRFLGIGEDQLNSVEIIAAFCITYPLTALPFSGIGILDSALYAILVSVGTGVDTAALIAGLIIWRGFTLALPLVLGGLTLLSWRKANPDAEEAAAEEIAEPAAADSAG